MRREGPGGRSFIETGQGVVVYPPRAGEGRDRWRAVWYETGQRRQCEASGEDRMAAKLARIAVRLTSHAPGLEQPGSALIDYYLSQDRLPEDRKWSRKHLATQQSLCRRFARPVIGELACQDITIEHMQAVVNAAPTAKEGKRARRMVSALVSAGRAGGYLVSPLLKEVHWQAGDRPAAPPPRPVPAGETALFVDAGQVPADQDVARLGEALRPQRDGLYELMVNLAAYSGLRWGEQAALTADQVSAADRSVLVDRKVVDIAGHLFTEAPKNRKWRRTIYPEITPSGYPLAARIAERAARARAEQQAGTNPLALMFPAPGGGCLRASNFARRMLAKAYQAAGWRPAAGSFRWTWHSLRHVFCTVALFTWKLAVTDVAQLAGHSSHRVTWEMYIGATAGTLERARAATAGPL
ncbi:MAG TPA: tyrosine-type recombinase/integrase, partial [Streptosporangiaceae bacterium]